MSNMDLNQPHDPNFRQTRNSGSSWAWIAGAIAIVVVLFLIFGLPGSNTNTAGTSSPTTGTSSSTTGTSSPTTTGQVNRPMTPATTGQANPSAIPANPAGTNPQPQAR